MNKAVANVVCANPVAFYTKALAAVREYPGLQYAAELLAEDNPYSQRAA